MVTSSNHLRGAAELMLVAPIKDGFINSEERLVSYSTRLEMLLDVLFQGRRLATEVRLLPGSGPIERLDAIFSTQWAIRSRPQRSELIVSAVFDSSWEAYLRNLQENTGELLDAIFCHCEGYAGNTCVEDGYERFSNWLRSRQVQTRFFHAATPDLTVKDLRGLRRFVMGDHDTRIAINSVDQSEALIRSSWPSPDQRAREALAFEHEKALNSMNWVGLQFSKTEKVGARTEREIYRDALRSLLGSSLDAAFKKRARDKELLVDGERAPATSGKANALDAPKLGDIQHNILRTHGPNHGWNQKVEHGLLVMLQCEDAQAIRKLVQAIHPYMATEAWADTDERLEINLAFTYSGLKRLGLDPAVLASMPPEFSAGMDNRAGLIGDVGPNAHPSTWEPLERNWPAPSADTAPLSNVDAVLIIHGIRQPSETDHKFDGNHPLYSDLKGLQLEPLGARILYVQPLRRYASDHFKLGEEGQIGGQPEPPWPPPEGPAPQAEQKKSRHHVPLGEVLLGHPNQHGDVAQWAVAPQSRGFFANGTFLVVRKLEQDVAAFERYLDRCAQALGVTQNLVRGWILGRFPDGRTLVKPGADDPLDDFDYSEPPAAFCPLHAHVRRANPRLKNTPRILRRSYPYGSPYKAGAPDEARGLVFMAYNASIAEQFEVIQRWLNGGNSTGLPSIVNDLIAGVPQVSGAQRWAPDSGTLRLPPPESPFVRLRWGLYLFVPSVSVLNKLNEQGAAPRAAAGELPPVDPRGLRIISEILDIESVARQREAWKEVLEEQQPDRLADASAVWAAIRHEGLRVRLANDFPKAAAKLLGAPAGTLPTEYGWLVSRYEQAREVFADDGQRFSVKEYQTRLQRLLDGHYLGLDENDCKYAELARDANRYLAEIASASVRRVAAAGARAVLRRAAAAGPLVTVRLDALAMQAIGLVTREYLSAPDLGDKPVATFIRPFLSISRYCFQPHPDEPLEKQARNDSEDLKKFSVRGAFADVLRQSRGAYSDEANVRSSVHGAIVGFAPPAVAHVIGILRAWLLTGELQRHAQRNDMARIGAVITAMTKVPVPPTLYRKTRSGARLDGVPLGDDEFVVVGTQSVTLDAARRAAGAAEEAWQWLFGGDKQGSSRHGQERGKGAVHGCPARHAAVHAIAGVIDAVCEFPNVRLCGALEIVPGSSAEGPTQPSAAPHVAQK